nr:6-phosphogluconolactonase [Acetobacter tropicalis]
MTTFNLDEYVGLSCTDTHSYRYYMQQHLFDLVNVRREQTYTLNGVASFPEAETQAYEEIITAKGGIDLQLLGIGENGHIGFNEPLSSLMSLTMP